METRRGRPQHMAACHDRQGPPCVHSMPPGTPVSWRTTLSFSPQQHATTTHHSSSGRQGICRNFNAGRCHFQHCARTHICLKCASNHSNASCASSEPAPTRSQPTVRSRTARGPQPSGWTPSPLAPSLTPVHTSHLRTLLSTHPDQAFTPYVRHGLDHGFTIGYTAPHFSPISPNPLPAPLQASFVFDHLKICSIRGEIAGPFTGAPFNPMQCSGVGVVPNKARKATPHQPPL